ncbi:MAG: RluA family pseudouridine synthase [Deltaproteobacteria bacterium]|nr:RluA family pseudouridine synthase [Deltaproteobacteria bacterium]MBN2671479.1 RluA family pseudouridine synthase [Deltaproteobacteria bacterium]
MKERPSHIPPEYLELILPVVKEFSGWRADRFVAHKIPRLSRSKVQRILKTLAFDQNGKPVKANRILRTDDHVVLYKEPPDEPDVCRDIRIIYEDDWYIAVDKPPRLPVHPTAKYLKNTLTYLLEELYGAENRPNLTHRLDSETSGIVLCAKTLDAERLAKGLFARRKVQKVYLAIIDGVISPESGRIEAPISPDPTTIIKARMWCGDPNGLPALTEYETLKHANGRSLLRMRPRTGRQHQLRVHLKHKGHIIVGDKLYAADQDLFLDYMQEGLSPSIIERAGHERQALHAHTLSFEHPYTRKPVNIESPLPEDMQRLI